MIQMYEADNFHRIYIVRRDHREILETISVHTHTAKTTSFHPRRNLQSLDSPVAHTHHHGDLIIPERGGSCQAGNPSSFL